MNSLLYRLAGHGDISWLSYYFAELITKQAGVGVDDLLGLGAALVCEANQAGDVCIDLDAFNGQPLFVSARLDEAELPRGPDSPGWRAHLTAFDIVGAPGDAAPLIVEGNRLYLNRYWYYENRVAEIIVDRLQIDDASTSGFVSDHVNRLFNGSDEQDRDQKLAVTMAATKQFSVISGGPGTGKTTTVIRILSTLISAQPEIRIALAAPTGKAAARMMESITNRIDDLDISDDLRRAIPTRASTIHRLLGYGHRSFRYHREHRIPIDCVVIDEASMIDLGLMFHLLDALPDHARIVLLGDRDQLASVSAGNVLGDITGHGVSIADTRASIGTSIALLRHSYRFETSSGIGKLSESVNLGMARDAIEVLESADPSIRWFASDRDELDADAMQWILQAFAPIFGARSALDALQIHEASRVLAATNHGPLGVLRLNRIISNALLGDNGLPESKLFCGLPIMVTRNHHDLGLFNGDTGILWQQPEGLRACFRDGEGGLRSLALHRLPEIEPAWVSTVHKSQGSEFDSILLILPSDPDSSALSRELLYTAVTRARHFFLLQASREAVVGAIGKLTRRYSGLAQRLGWPA
ncbi:MAG: exodeoxyribonuclease V subunit alpha [Gammaproteobacteria bacterium]|nr:exodeoxyribonuclease V subunit alpha [Gammaproteobacteria bacterium]MDH3447442.1 exodeoxyribonuclease V subunit alpha [Gammaproteobacteria bacterium]